MPEAGYLPIPSKLARAGVKDMVRISDARMSGTAFGTIVLHVAPEAAVGGPLAAVRNGDRIRLSVANKRIDLLVDEAEIRRRLADCIAAARARARLRRALPPHRHCRRPRAATSTSSVGARSCSPERPASRRPRRSNGDTS